MQEEENNMDETTGPTSGFSLQFISFHVKACKYVYLPLNIG